MKERHYCVACEQRANADGECQCKKGYAAIKTNEKNVFDDITKERERQFEKWGEQNHKPYKWLTILGEEYGETCKEALENNHDNYRKELVQVAAVAVAALEAHDRKMEIKMNEIHEKLEDIFGYAKQINESRRPVTGIWYYVYLEPKWELYIYKADEYQNISHLEAWIKYIVPKLEEFYGLDKKDILEDAYRGFPRGRVDLNTSPEIIDPSNKFMIFHGDDFPSSLSRATEEGKILNGFNLAGLIARGLAEFKFAYHETMDLGHKKVVESIIEAKIPY